MRIDWHCVCGDGESVHRSHPRDGEICNGHCQRTERECHTGYRPIDHSYHPPAFKAMLAALEGDEHPWWPAAYTCDVSSDYQMLREIQTHWDADIAGDERFVWIVRESGTQFLPLAYLPTDEHSFMRQALSYHKRNHAEARIYFWDGQTIARIDYDRAEDILARR